MMIEVLGPGCARCNKTAEIIRKGGEEMGDKRAENFCVNEVEDMSRKAARGDERPGARIVGGRRQAVRRSGQV